MRQKDEAKREAITRSIVSLINEIGFVDISMSKIAKATGISPSTLYVYYENKEDMFRKIYLEVKRRMIELCGEGLDPKAPVGRQSWSLSLRSTTGRLSASSSVESTMVY